MCITLLYLYYTDIDGKCKQSQAVIYKFFLKGVSAVANRIKGITVEIGGDTTKLQTALKGGNSSIRDTQSQLRDVEKLLKLDHGNTELLAQKHRLLGELPFLSESCRRKRGRQYCFLLYFHR